MKDMRLKIVPSYVKCFEKDTLDSFAKLETGSVLKKDFYAFEVLVDTDGPFVLNVETALSQGVSIYAINDVPLDNPMPAYWAEKADDYYLNENKPGRYPDLFIPVKNGETVEPETDRVNAFWVQIDVAETQGAGVYPFKVSAVSKQDALSAEDCFNLEVIDAVLPEQTLIYTQWFHCDCLATYYKVDVFSEEHWQIIETYLKMATKNGMNMLLMPTFTPPLDTEVGGERPTVQLVGVTKTKDGYAFDFSKVDRWLDMCDRCGIKYHEITHMFTQWGAEHAPKIMADVDGEQKRIFGWETDSLSEEYIDFVKQFLAAFKAYMKKKGLLDKCMFHFSDEPGPDHVERYKALKVALEDSLQGCAFGDALSNYEFYATGSVKHPIVATNHIEPFLENKVPELWGYYCCSQVDYVSNRFINMSMNRTRVIGTQLFKTKLQGFLQWGYNFYYSQFSKREIDPYTCFDGIGDGVGWVPAGDAFSVYPAPGGVPYPSMHMLGFTQALSDLRAFELLESLTSYEETLALIENVAGMSIEFKKYPHTDDFSQKVREAVNAKIKACIK